MDFTPTICIARLLVALQVLMTLLVVMPLRTTITTATALPVTSKPIESTAENLAWQAWIMLPPEQKQLIKSRKVTPKSIFTLPQRVQCPEGHQQVDSKCLPTVIGTNDVLIDPNALGLVLGDAPTADIEYDYEDETIMGDGGSNGGGNNMPFNPPLFLMSGHDGKSNTETVLELKPPSQDEPLKFNIFQSKFPTDDYPLEDYSGLSNEGAAAQAPPVVAPVLLEDQEKSRNSAVNVTNDKDMVGEASNDSKSHSLNQFNLESLEAISVPVHSSSSPSSSSSTNGQDFQHHRISLFNEDSAIHLVTTLMDTEGEEDVEEKSKPHDLESLLQTESLMPMLNHTTASTLVALESLPLTQANTTNQTSMDVDQPSALQIEDVEEITTIMPELMMNGHSTLADTEEQQTKAEFVRSVTMNPMYDEDSSNSKQDEDEQDVEFTTTLTPSTGNGDEQEVRQAEEMDEAFETTTMDPSTTIQLDDTTIIEGNIEITTIIPQEQEPASSTTESATTSSTTSSSTSPVSESLQELLEQSLQDFEELQKDQQHNVKKKSKVEPVEVLATRTTAAMPAAATTTATVPTASMASQQETTTTATLDELITTSGETVTPLLTVHNNIDNNNKSVNKNNNNSTNNNVNKEHNNDRFYYQHFGKQDLESAALKSDVAKETTTTTTTPTSTTTTPSSTSSSSSPSSSAAPAAETSVSPSTTTSEIDLAEELRLINELVKGNKQRPGITLTASETTTLKTTKTSQQTNDDVDNEIHTSPKPAYSVSASPPPSESSASSIKYTLETTKIWSKIMPLIKTTTTTTTTEKSPEVTGNFKINEETSTANSNTEVDESSSSSVSPSTTPNESSTATTTTKQTPNAASLVVSNRSHRNSKIIRINGLNSLDFKQGKKTLTATTTTTADISSTTTSTERITQEDSTSATIESSTSSTTHLADENEDDAAAAAAEVEHNDESEDNNAFGPFWWLPISWRLDSQPNKETATTTSTTVKPDQSPEQQQEDMPLLLRFWSTYHAPKSS
ncbi:folded gastrulation [Musca autumnalis]|uniref:folded gastrulation n=1 Tax=Musca autumnalis TaxID=221902 RepID=UPI003CE9B79C